MNKMKKLTSVMLTLALLLGVLVMAVPFSASAYDNTKTFTINGYDKALPNTGAHSNIYVFTNTGSSTKSIHTDTYKFETSRFLVFDGNGKILEAGAELYSGSSKPQSHIDIPAGGFVVGFGANANAELNTIYGYCVEDAYVRYETFHVAFDLKGSYNKSTNKLTLEYNTPKAPSANSKSFLFVGNSCTYFNSNPLKFKAIAAAAGQEVEVYYCTIGSAYLVNFADPNHETCGVQFREDIAARKYDYVVLQDNSGADFKQSKKGADVLMPFIKENGATPILYARYASTSGIDAREAKSYEHYRNYAQLAREYGIDMIAPGGDAMMICARKYPEIEMFAQDRSHHSVEASYMIACCYAMAYLGIDVRGNSYTAGLPAATVAKLQECAYLACTEGYAYPQISYTEGDARYENIAKYKPYTSTGKAYVNESHYLTDTGADGQPLSKLTDTAYGWTGDDPAVGAYSGKTLDIVIDLEGTHVVRAARTDLIGDSWGIPNPNNMTVEFSVSTDKVNWKSLGTVTKSAETVEGDWKQRFFNVSANNFDNVANYVKVTYKNVDESVANNFFWSSDIQVFGYKTNNVDNTPDIPDGGNQAQYKSYTTTGIYSDSGNTPYPDEGGKTLTDTVIADTAASYDNVAFVGFNSHTSDYARDGYASVTVDLEEVFSLDKFVARVSTDNEYTTSAGVHVIDNVDFYVSKDGTNWTKAGSAVPSATANDTNATLTLSKPVAGRYVQYRFSSDTSWMMVSEVEAYGAKYVEPDTMLGDLNGNEEIDAVDYSLLKRAYFGAYTTDVVIGDVNGNDEIDAVDYSLLKRAYFGAYALS